MNPALHLRLALDPALAWLEGMGVRSDDRARVQLLAIGGQESGWRHRRQVPVAHAMGLYQFEKGGGVTGVLRHAGTGPIAAQVCAGLLVKPEPGAVHAALEQNDTLAACFARLLLWSDPKALPQVDQEEEGWLTYLRCWRPGKPHPDAWAAHWQAARMVVGARSSAVA
jgi:hypothetical protein